MNTTFSFNRIGLLLRRYFIEKKRSEIIYWSIITILFMFLHWNYMIICLFLIVSGLFYAARLPREIHEKPNNINYFMFPANQIEKYIVYLVLVLVYYLVMFTISYMVGNIVGRLLYNMMSNFGLWNSVGVFTFELFAPSKPIFSSPEGFALEYPSSFLLGTLLGFLFTQSAFLVGGIYFSKNAAAKTILVSLAFFLFAVVTISRVIYNTALKNNNLVQTYEYLDNNSVVPTSNAESLIEFEKQNNKSDISENDKVEIQIKFNGSEFYTETNRENLIPHHNEFDRMLKNLEKVGSIIQIFLIVFLWFIGFIRLKEKEV